MPKSGTIYRSLAGRRGWSKIYIALIEIYILLFTHFERVGRPF